MGAKIRKSRSLGKRLLLILRELKKQVKILHNFRTKGFLKIWHVCKRKAKVLNCVQLQNDHVFHLLMPVCINLYDFMGFIDL